MGEYGVFLFFALAIALIVYRRQFNKAVKPGLKKIGEAGDKVQEALKEGTEKLGDALEEARDVVVAKVEEVKAQINDEK